MIKKSQLFGWEHEPAAERRSALPDLSDTQPVSNAAVRSSLLAPQLQREAPNARDQTLTSLAASWLYSLPGDVRPTALCDRYPRIANRLALCWADPVLTARILDDLLNDKRGGRKGFPGDVAKELSCLAVSLGKRPLSKNLKLAPS